MIKSWQTILAHVKLCMPKCLPTVKPSANFITLHYLYVIGWTLLGSVIMYGHGRIPYIDALFFASGAATQSGLNTYVGVACAEVSIMLIACVCNTIFINTTVVFVRLYWFEKRFQHVTRESQLKRRSSRVLVKSNGNTMADPERNSGLHQTGVGNREIRVMRGSRGHAYGGYIENEFAFNDGQDRTGDGIRLRRRSSLDEPDHLSLEQATAPSQSATDTVEANQVQSAQGQDRVFTSVDLPINRLPQATVQKSRAFVEAQQSTAARGILRIPDPRDFDQGHVPERVLDDGMVLSSSKSRESDQSRPEIEAQAADEHNEIPAHLEHHITIDIPHHQQNMAKPSAYKRTKTAEAESFAPSANRARTQSQPRTLSSFLTRQSEDFVDPVPYLSWTPTIGRNSNFVDLTEEQREELGGIEYRALKLLALILVCFFVGFHLMGMVCLVPWINGTSYRAVSEEVSISPTWWGFFTAASLFNDLGFTLTPNSMISFQQAVFPLMLGIFLIVIGNTGFPCMLRFIIWAVSKCVPKSSGVWEELRFLLDHPRRCFTLLFPSKATWILFWILILLNGIDLVIFIVLDVSALGLFQLQNGADYMQVNDPTVTSIPPGFRFLAGLFQAASTRTAGFAVVNLPDLHPAVQVSYMIMMYISVFPIAMSIRQSNVYEEKSIGVWPSGEPQDAQSSYLSHHLRRQLSFDLWFVFLGFFLIAIIEGSRLDNLNEYGFTLFAILFEIVSAYGTVGLSQGFPGTDTSFSGQFRTLSKLVIIAMQIRGRHRGLPYGLDRAILLPSESLHLRENDDATRRARVTSGVEDGLAQAATGSSRRSTRTSGRLKRTAIFKSKRLRSTLAGAFRAGPPTRE